MENNWSRVGNIPVCTVESYEYIGTVCSWVGMKFGMICTGTAGMYIGAARYTYLGNYATLGTFLFHLQFLKVPILKIP